MKSLAVWRTNYHRIYVKLYYLTNPRWKGGRISRHLRAMSGFAGLSPPKDRRPEAIISSGQSQSFWKESAVLVVGSVAFTAKSREQFVNLSWISISV